MEWLGVVAACLTTVSFLPQAIYVVKTKDTSGISLGMYTLFVIGVCLWSIYGFLIKDLSIIAANSVTFVFASTILILKVKYK